VIRLKPPQVVEVAARAGYDTVGLRLIGGTETTPAYPLMDDKPLMRATKAAMSATGIGVLDIEFVRITPEIDVAALEPFMAAGAELGARYVIASAYDPDLNRFTERLAAVSDLASQYGLRAVLEFFPWTVVPDLSAAMRIVEAAERPALGILVDTLHFNRSASGARPKSFCTRAASSGCRPARAASTSSASLLICLRTSRWRWRFP
jgi:sugar phosphate isomerase/epimerase